MTRKQAITYMILAGKENDQRARVRLLVESRVNRAALNDAWSKGQALGRKELHGHPNHA